MMSDFKFLCEIGIFMIPLSKKRKKDKQKPLKTGDLLNIRDKLCLVLKISKHKQTWQRKVMIQWVHNGDTYWISYQILNDLIKEKRDV